MWHVTFWPRASASAAWRIGRSRVECGDNGLLDDPQLVDHFTRMGGFRNRLVHHHEDVTPEELFDFVGNRLADIEAIADALARAAAEIAG